MDKMKEFFNLVSDDYDNHMKENIEGFNDFYKLISDRIQYTTDKIKILDLGIGTGLELPGIFIKAPNSIIDGIDVSEKMLNVLLSKHQKNKHQLNLINKSYIDCNFEQNNYDYAVSVMTLHHLPADLKIKLYKKIFNALKMKSMYIEGDYYVSMEKEKYYLESYYKEISDIPDYQHGDFHLDIPFSIESQKNILRESGFNKIDVLYELNDTGIIIASKE